MYGGILVACYSKRCILKPFFGIWKRFALVYMCGLQVGCGLTEVGASTAPAIAARLPAAARSKIKIVYVWRYLSSLLFQAVHIYNLFWCIRAICFGTCERFVLV